MKKRLFALILAVATVMGMLVMPASADATGLEPTAQKTCPHCGVAWDSCNWQVLIIEEPDKTIPSGHYYLDSDLNITTRYKVGTSEGQTQEYAVDVCLDLRGYNLTQTTADRRAFCVYDYSTFSIMDSVGGSKVTGSGATGSNAAGGTIYASNDAIVNLYSGTLTYNGAAKTKNGGVMYINVDAIFNMYGGIIDASMITAEVNADTSQYPCGAAIAASGEVNISGGLILGGYMHKGGAIVVNPSGEVNISGGAIYGGEAISHGGNIYSQGTLNISGGTISGGKAGGRGGNIHASGSGNITISGGVIEDGHCSTYGGNLTIGAGKGTVSGGFIQGNMQVLCDVTFTGNPVIDNNGYEGLIASKPITIDGLTKGAKIVLWGDGTFTNADTSPNVADYIEKGYLIPASRYDVQVVDGALVGSKDDTGYCPHCGKDITWEVYTADTCTSGHYYIPAGGVVPNKAAKTIAKDVDIVLNLTNGSVKTTTPYTVAGTLSILSTSGSVGSFYNTSDSTTANGGAMTVTGTLNMYDGIISGTTTTGNGGTVYLNDGKLNMHGGRIEGGTAANGGSVYLDGTGAAMTMYRGVIVGGTATSNGGNLYIHKGTFNMNGGMVLKGRAKGGGNIIGSNKSKLNIHGGIVALGTASGTGGNLRTSATDSITVFTDGLFYGGTAPDGGNCYINNGKFTMTGGSLVNGIATTGSSGNLCAHAGYYYINKGEEPTDNWVKIGDDNPKDNIPAPLISGGQAAVNGGNINATGNLTLGDCTVTGGRAETGGDLYLGQKAYLTVESGFAQALTMYLHSTRIAQLSENRAITNTFCTALNGTLYAENYDMACLLPTAEGQLGLGGAALVEVATGKQTWFMDAQSAADACTATQYVCLYAPESTLELNKTLVLDLNGTRLTLTGTGKLFGFDTANDDYEVYGTATVTGVAVEPLYMAPNNRRYVAVTDENGTSFHRLGMGISHVSLRPSVSGLYYKGLWQCDSVLASQISSYGVAVSVENMPGENFATDSDTLYTVLEGDSFVSGQAQPSAIIENILSADGDNDQSGRTDIYAAAYAIMADGTVIVGDDSKQAEGGVSYSLHEVVKNVNRRWPKLTDTQQENVKILYNRYVDTMTAWDLYNITAAVKGTAAHRPLKILTLGHSLAVDAGYMLNLVAAAEGFTDLTVATLYYSGCALYQHVRHLQNDLPEYSLYLSSSNTPDQIPTIQKSVTMKSALKYDDWDIIIMQGGVFEIANSSKYTDGKIQIIQDYVNQHKTNPDAIFAWNSPWAPPTTDSLRNKYRYEPNVYYTSYEEFNHDRTTMYKAITQCLADHIVTDDSFVYLIPSCTSIENALSSYLEETDLHRDYVHMTDLGRVIASYTWYCTLAGIDHLDEVKLDAIPAAFFKTTTGTQDRVLTDMEKAIILESVNNALANPLQITQSQYTEAPTK